TLGMRSWSESNCCQFSGPRGVRAMEKRLRFLLKSMMVVAAIAWMVCVAMYVNWQYMGHSLHGATREAVIAKFPHLDKFIPDNATAIDVTCRLAHPLAKIECNCEEADFAAKCRLWGIAPVNVPPLDQAKKQPLGTWMGFGPPLEEVDDGLYG